MGEGDQGVGGQTRMTVAERLAVAVELPLARGNEALTSVVVIARAC